MSAAKDLLNDPDIDLVVIATPNDTHFPLAKAALEAGKHVVVDKPFTVTLSQARELESLAKHCGRVLSVFHNRRWDSDFLTVRALINEGQLGEVCYFESHFDRFRPQVRQRWREQGGPGSGIWYDLGPHLLDQAVVLFGLPVSITVDLAQLRPGAQSTDYFMPCWPIPSGGWCCMAHCSLRRRARALSSTARGPAILSSALILRRNG